MLREVLIVGLSVVGMLISVYFMFVYHNILSPETKLLPAFCRLDSGSCGHLLATPQARLFGIPNFYAGLFYYSSLILLVVFPSYMVHFRFIFLIVSSLTVVVALYLSFILLFRLRIRCILCLISHGINVSLFILLLSLFS